MTVNTAVNKQKMQYGAPTKNIPKKTFKNSHALKYKKKIHKALLDGSSCCFT